MYDSLLSSKKMASTSLLAIRSKNEKKAFIVITSFLRFCFCACFESLTIVFMAPCFSYIKITSALKPIETVLSGNNLNSCEI